MERHAAELRELIARATTEAAALERAIDAAREQLRLVEETLASTASQARAQGTIPSVRTGRARNPERREVADRALQAIRAAGRPLSRRTLFQRLTAGGLQFYGKDPEMVMGTMLWREKDRIVRIRGHGYWAADETYEPAFYIPGHERVIGAVEQGRDDDGHDD